MAPRRTFTHAHDAPDLAAIVLADPEPRRDRLRGYDARSVLLLALVVAMLAAVVVGMMSLGTDDAAKVETRSDTTHSALADLDGDTAVIEGAGAKPIETTAKAPTTPAATPAAPAGIALAVGRITATPDRAKGALVVRVAVANAGTDALVSGAGAQLLVLIDDHVIGQADLGTLSPRGGRVTVPVSTYQCTPGRHVVTAIADATARVRHADGFDTSRSTELTITCPS